jgi:hypothetical protein
MNEIDGIADINDVDTIGTNGWNLAIWMRWTT